MYVNTQFRNQSSGVDAGMSGRDSEVQHRCESQPLTPTGCGIRGRPAVALVSFQGVTLSKGGSIFDRHPGPGSTGGEALEAISGLFIELLALGNTLWSDLDEKQAAENRMLLVGPYVDQLRELTRAASARGLKARSKDEEPEAEKEPPESAEPTPATDSAEAAEATPATTSAEPAASVRPEEPEDGTS